MYIMREHEIHVLYMYKIISIHSINQALACVAYPSLIQATQCSISNAHYQMILPKKLIYST